VRWGFVFVACPVKLTEEQRMSLVRLAAHAWFTDQDEVRFDWEGCEGVVRVASDTMSLGTFVGQRFTAEVNLAEESGKVEFLVAEHHLRAEAEA
jgi:xanthine dehydrogenase molybdopterin-binding subunit B